MHCTRNRIPTSLVLLTQQPLCARLVCSRAAVVRFCSLCVLLFSVMCRIFCTRRGLIWFAGVASASFGDQCRRCQSTEQKLLLLIVTWRFYQASVLYLHQPSHHDDSAISLPLSALSPVTSAASLAARDRSHSNDCGSHLFDMPGAV